MAGPVDLRPCHLLLFLLVSYLPGPIAAAEPKSGVHEDREVHPPTDVTWASTDLNNTLRWRPAVDAGTGTTYTVECRGQRVGSWQPVPGCVNITAHLCVMNDATDFMGGWTARVSAHDQQQSSGWAVSPNFRPAKETILSTPHLGLDNMAVGTDDITVTCTLPRTPFDKDEPWEYYNARYTLTWWKEGGNKTNTLTGEELQTTLDIKDLHPGTPYCLTIKWSIRVPPDRDSNTSEIVCVTTKERVPTEGPKEISLKPLPINCAYPSNRDVVISWADDEVEAEEKPYEVKSYDVTWSDQGAAGEPVRMVMTVNASDTSVQITCHGFIEVDVRACNTEGCGPPTRRSLKFSRGDHIECTIWTSVAVLVVSCIGLALLVGIVIFCRKTRLLSKEQRAKRSKLPSILEEVVKGSGDGSYWPVSDKPRPEVYDVLPTLYEISQLTSDTSSDETNSTSEEVFTPSTPPLSNVPVYTSHESPCRSAKPVLGGRPTDDEHLGLIVDQPDSFGNFRPTTESVSTYVSSIADTTSYTSDPGSPQPEKSANERSWNMDTNNDDPYVTQSQLGRLQAADPTALPPYESDSEEPGGATGENATEEDDFRKYSGLKSPSKMTADQFSKMMPKCVPKMLSEEISDYVSVG